ncbi:type IIS restriction enzyme Eco57I [Clostridium acetireducens DSM 10703]|uniref:site-specific DNA-methyltransferase (adenine-specific) n=1 Tax=Clostridium acetireducens DSM 10703 TaxID=1121290 RepID=A0A1E8EXY4_9CLOT|nr:DNA methyltransferase [Clostridium acetireducens]OFI05803.1 type IIS restriction enzyme Eco57I [Clostridium acetireducens DSM 10703]
MIYKKDIDKFINIIEDIYNVILQPIDSIYKITAIIKYKRKLNIKNSYNFGDFYYNIMDKNKEKGVIYTPDYIARYVVKNTISKESIIKNPYLKIVDPACGCGNIIINCFNHLRKLFIENLDEINEFNNISLKKEDIDRHIICNNLYGFDIDIIALKILIIDLFYLSGIIGANFLNRDFLIELDDEKFDIFIGNPPYVGHKFIDKEYSSIIKKKYFNIYKDKSDLHYCFFLQSLNMLNKKGKISFITSRYFLEGPSGENLRKILKNVCSINKIVDFYGIRPFKNIGIDPLIIFLINEQNSNEYIEVIKPLKGVKKDSFCKSVFLNEGKEYDKFNINKNKLNNKGWILRNREEMCIINKIEEKSFTTLNNICNSFQGIITGCDKAFVVNKKIIDEENLEKDIIKPWIKSSFIQKNKIHKKDMFLIYSDLITQEEKYTNIIKHIYDYKERLMNRRECKKGVRQWYHLQWGRIQNIFEDKKIVFPFKSNKNRFALDKGSYFSADIYCLTLKENVPFTYEYLLYLLNEEIAQLNFLNYI